MRSQAGGIANGHQEALSLCLVEPLGWSLLGRMSFPRSEPGAIKFPVGCVFLPVLWENAQTQTPMI